MSRWSGAGSPGIGGYALAWLVSVVVVGVEVTAPALLEEPLGFLVLVAFVWVYAAVFGVPAALLGVLLVHLLTLRVRHQWVHVALAGLVGSAAGAAYTQLLFADDMPGLAWELGVATAVGRAAVVPMARARSARVPEHVGA